MKIINLVGQNIKVIPSYIDTYNAIILDYSINGWLLQITKIAPHEKTKKIGDIEFIQNIGNFTLIK